MKREPMFVVDRFAVYRAKRRPWWWVQVSVRGWNGTGFGGFVAPFWRATPWRLLALRARADRAESFAVGRKQGVREGRSYERASAETAAQEANSTCVPTADAKSSAKNLGATPAENQQQPRGDHRA